MDIGAIVCIAILIVAALRRGAILLRAWLMLQARSNSILRFDANVLILVPIRDEPSMAATAAIWWAQNSNVTPWFVVTRAEEPARTEEALRVVGVERIVLTNGRTKAEMLLQALEAVAEKNSFVWIFDSDSRPTGDFQCRNAVGMAPCQYILSPSVSRLAPLWAGGALWQSVWSYGFEAWVVHTRKLWYLVGHGLGAVRSMLAGFDAAQRCEDLALGYTLSSRAPSVYIVGGSDVALWTTEVTAYMPQLARWFIGDVQAVLSQRPFTFRHGMRLLELVLGWWLGPLICMRSWLFARVSYPDLADLGGILLIASVIAPVMVVPSLIPRDINSRWGVALGLLLRPILDFAACSFGVIQWISGLSPVHDRRVTRKEALCDPVGVVTGSGVVPER